jgi:hypothetical protein
VLADRRATIIGRLSVCFSRRQAADSREVLFSVSDLRYFLPAENRPKLSPPTQVAPRTRVLLNPLRVWGNIFTRFEVKNLVDVSKPDLQIELQERLRFETLVADISARFVNVPADQVDSEIEDAQRRICECLKIEHSSLWQVAPDRPGALILTHLYRDSSLPPAPDRLYGPDCFPWTQAQGMANGIVCVPDTSKLPPEAAIDRENCLKYSIKATIGFPLVVGGGPIFGAIGFEAIHEPRDWPEALQNRLRLIAQVFANALERKNAEKKLRESEARLSLAAASADAGLWTLDPDTSQIWATDKTFEVLGLTPVDGFDLEQFLVAVECTCRRPRDRVGALSAGSPGSSPEVGFWDICRRLFTEIHPDRRTKRNVWFAAPSPAVHES